MTMGEPRLEVPVFIFKKILRGLALQHNVFVDPNNISNVIDYTWQLSMPNN